MYLYIHNKCTQNTRILCKQTIIWMWFISINHLTTLKKTNKKKQRFSFAMMTWISSTNTRYCDIATLAILGKCLNKLAASSLKNKQHTIRLNVCIETHRVPVYQPINKIRPGTLRVPYRFQRVSCSVYFIQGLNVLFPPFHGLQWLQFKHYITRTQCAELGRALMLSFRIRWRKRRGA